MAFFAGADTNRGRAGVSAVIAGTADVRRTDIGGKELEPIGT